MKMITVENAHELVALDNMNADLEQQLNNLNDFINKCGKTNTSSTIDISCYGIIDDKSNYNRMETTGVHIDVENLEMICEVIKKDLETQIQNNKDQIEKLYV